MSANLEVLAAWAQILSLPLSIVSLALTFIIWIYPGPPRIAPIARRLRSFLPYVFIAAFFFWVGTWLRPSISYDSIQSCDSYKIAILSPMSGETVTQNEVIHGSYSIFPKNAEIWIFTVDRELGDYRPRVVVKDNGDGTWIANPSYIGQIGETVELVPFLVSENAHILIDYYNQVGREGNQWFALKTLPTDLVECESSVSVTVRQE